MSSFGIPRMKILWLVKALKKKKEDGEIVIAVYIICGVLRARDDRMVTYPF